jgi:hypothetical protein
MPTARQRQMRLPFWTTHQKARFIKDQFASNTPEDVAVMLRPLTEALALAIKKSPMQSDVFPLYDVR